MFAQPMPNLVVNPSFEELYDCPPATGLRGIAYSKGWFSWISYTIPPASHNFPLSVYTPCGDFWSDTLLWVVSPGEITNRLGYQKPQDGSNYADLVGNFEGKNAASAAISGTFIEPLEENVAYNIKFYISLADKTYGTYIRNLTLITHVDSNFHTSINPADGYLPRYKTFIDSIILSFENPVHKIPTQWLKDTMNWIEVNGKFTARGGERYFTIGKIQHSSEMEPDVVLDSNPWYWTSFYYIDNVQIWAEPDPVIQEPKLPLVIPNVITPNQDGYNDYWQLQNLAEGTQVFIYNRWGTKVYQSNNYQNNWPQPNIAPSPGTYFYIVRTQVGEEFKGSLIVNY